MKRIIALLLLVATLFSIAACTPGGDNSGTTPVDPNAGGPTAGETTQIVLGTGTTCDYILIYNTDNFTAATTQSSAIAKAIKDKTGMTITVKKSQEAKDLPADTKAILLGDTEFVESANIKTGMRNQDWAMDYQNNKIVINGTKISAQKLKADWYGKFGETITQNAQGQWVMSFTSATYIYDYSWDKVLIGTNQDLSDYTIIYGEKAYTVGTSIEGKANRMLVDGNKAAALELQSLISSKYGYDLEVKSDSTAKTSKEILVGLTNRAESTTLKDELAKYGSYNGCNTIAYKVINGKLVIYAYIDMNVLKHWVHQEQLATTYTDPENVKYITAPEAADLPRVVGIRRAGNYFATLLSEFVESAETPKNIKITAGRTKYYDTICGDYAKADGTQLRVISANIESEEWIGGGDGSAPYLRKEYYKAPSKRINAFMNTMEMYQPDVVGLQEIYTSWHNALNTAISGTKWKLTANSSISGVKNFNPILYNSETVEVVKIISQTFYSSRYNAKNARSLSVVVFKHKVTKKEFVVMNTHWDTWGNEGTSTGDKEAASRKSQAQEMAAKIVEVFKTYKTIITTGDYNTTSITYDKTTTPATVITSTAESHGYKSQDPYKTFVSGISSTGMQDMFWKLQLSGKPVTATMYQLGVDHVFATAGVTPLNYKVTRLRGQAEVAGDHAQHVVDFKFS